MSNAKIYLVRTESFQPQIAGMFSSEALAIQFASHYDEDTNWWLEVWQVDGESRLLEQKSRIHALRDWSAP